MRALILSGAWIGVVASIIVFQVSIVSAQTSQDDLRAVIRAELSSDPRASTLPAKQLDEMINALASAAASQGISAQDISWRPQPISDFSASAAAATTESCDYNSFLCTLTHAFGFSGSDLTIPIWLGISSAILILVLWGLIEIHRRKHTTSSTSETLSV
ncbi:MAG: hypothetical protein Q8R25_04900 [bacterium]|nr:hypothetical protein [bacterium]